MIACRPVLKCSVLWMCDNFVPSVLQAVKSTGLLTSDPRLRDCMDKLRRAVRESNGDVMMDHKLFRRCVCVTTTTLFKS